MTRGPCQCHAEIRAELAAMRALLERLVMPSEIAPEPEPVPPLVRALGATFGGSCFTAREAWQHASEEAAQAAACGRPEPDLSAAFRALGIDGTRSLGFQLARHEEDGTGVRRGGLQHNTNTWEVLAWARER